MQGRARTRTLKPAIAIIALLAVLPLLPLGERLQYMLALGLVYAIAAVALDVFSGYSGQLTLGNFGFVAIGAYAATVAASELEASAWVGLPAAVLAAGLAGFIVGLPMVRLPNLGGSLVTFFFAFVVVILIAGNTFAGVTGSTNGLAVPPLTVGEQDLNQGLALYYLAGAVLAFVVLLSARYAASRAGKALMLVKRSPVVAASLGVNVRRSKLSAFVYSAAGAGAAGFVYAQAVGYLAPENFDSFESINLLAMAVVGGLGSIVGPVLGAVGFNALAEASRGAEGARELVFAVGLLGALVLLPNGIYGWLERRLEALRRHMHLGFLHRRQVTKALSVHPASTEHGSTMAPDVEATRLDLREQLTNATSTGPTVETMSELLRVEDVSVRFGGLHALDDVTVSVTSGTIHAVLGPNGAGKTTLLNCISGFQPYVGRITFAGLELDGLGASDVRAAGISRTFQNPSLVPDLTVQENVELGAYGLAPGGLIRDLLPIRSTRARDRRAAQLARSALDLVGFAPARLRCLASELTMAEQKVVDIARAVAAESPLVLLDEPTAGLEEADIDTVAATLRAINQRAGRTIVVIAHHVGFLRAVASQATVLDFGQVLATGTPDEVMSRADVTEIYLGAAHA